MVKLTIDGKVVEVLEGTTVLRAARQAGILIPTLCDHPELTPYGGCRLCLVEIEGARTLQPSCTLPVSNNLVVRTNTERVHAARKFALTLIFSERNHFCPFCQVSGGDCELQNAALAEDMSHWPLQPNYQPFSVDASHPYFVLDNNRCILCRRCVRACGEMVGNYTLGIEERGARSFLIADFGTPLGNSTCVSCGTCLQVCPTGALIDRRSAYHGKETQIERNPTICIGCSVGCGIEVLMRDKNVVRIEGDWNAPVNHGLLCENGRFKPLEDQGDRIITPLIRKNGSLKKATWDEALDLAVAHLKTSASQKAGGVAALASTRLPAEVLNTFRQIFIEGLNSNMVTSIEEGRPTALQAKLAKDFGTPIEGKLSILDEADLIFTIGVNLIDNHQVVGFFVKRAVPKGAKIIVVDPSNNPLDPYAELVLKPTVSADAYLLEGLCAALFQLGLSKKPVKTSNSLKFLASKAGIKQEDLIEAAQMLGSANKPVILYGKGITAQESDHALKNLLQLAEAIGALTENAARLISLKGEANSLAAVQYGLDTAFELNGHETIYVAMGDDKPSRRLMQKLEKAAFLLVQATYSSPLTEKADVVFPVTGWLEQEGYYLNLEGKLQQAHAIQTPPNGVWSNMDVLNALSARLGITPIDNWKEQLFRRLPVVRITADA